MLGAHVVVHGVVAGEGAVAVLALNTGALRVVDLHVADKLVGSVEVLVAHNTRELLLSVSLLMDIKESLEVDLPVRGFCSGPALFVTTNGVRKRTDGTRVTALNEVVEVAGIDVLLLVVAEVLEQWSSILELDSADLADDRWQFPSPMCLRAFDGDSLSK